MQNRSRGYFWGQVLLEIANRLRVYARSAGAIGAVAVLTTAASAFAPVRALSANVEPITVGAIAVSAGPAAGHEAVSVSGKAPALAPVTVTVFATISRDLPDVFINRRDVLTDASGHFSALLPIAPDFWRGTILTVTASSPDVTSTATAKTTVVAPNPGVYLPADDLPNH